MKNAHCRRMPDAAELAYVGASLPGLDGPKDTDEITPCNTPPCSACGDITDPVMFRTKLMPPT